MYLWSPPTPVDIIRGRGELVTMGKGADAGELFTELAKGEEDDAPTMAPAVLAAILASIARTRVVIMVLLDLDALVMFAMSWTGMSSVWIVEL